MSAEDFFDPAAHEAIRKAVARFEKRTSVELVVAVRRSADVYRDADYLAGASFAFLVFLLLLFLPQPFAVAWMPLDVVIGFVVGAGATAFAPPLKRLFLTRTRMNVAVDRAALADLATSGVTETRARTGCLVYVAVLERSVRVVWDVGARKVETSPSYDMAMDALRASVAQLDREAFVRSLARIGDLCQKTMPRAADDENELSDEVRA